MTFQILNSKEKEKIFIQLKENFGISKLQGILTKSGKEKIFLFQGDFTVEEIQNLEKIVPVERIGIYFAKYLSNNEVKLSLDGVELLKNQITKNILELNKEQAQEWMSGNEIPIKTNSRNFLIIKYQDYLLGTGKASEEKITNFIPKVRRLKLR